MQGESNSISNQKRILETYAKQNGFTNLRWYTDDGYSGANFQRPGLDVYKRQVVRLNLMSLTIFTRKALGKFISIIVVLHSQMFLQQQPV